MGKVSRRGAPRRAARGFPVFVSPIRFYSKKYKRFLSVLLRRINFGSRVGIEIAV
jgi:hypothetical protein